MPSRTIPSRSVAANASRIRRRPPVTAVFACGRWGDVAWRAISGSASRRSADAAAAEGASTSIRNGVLPSHSSRSQYAPAPRGSSIGAKRPDAAEAPCTSAPGQIRGGGRSSSASQRSVLTM